ncbi:MAG: hypothetical protein NTV02_01935 [Candidatus Zambryskibacteria bacterium]|nr:hypothetical protein [Candidatus Zambryskibacteria bacterium]
MKKTHHYTVIGLLLVCISLAVVGYALVINQVWEKAQMIASYKDEVVGGEQKKQYAEAMLSSFEESRSDINQIKDGFVLRNGEVEFIEYIELLAKEKNLKIEIGNVSIDPANSLEKSGLEYLLLRFKIEGLWVNVWSFSEILEVVPYSVTINSLSFVREDANPAPGVSAQWKGTYTIKVLKKK